MLKNLSHPMYHSVKVLGSSFSARLLHLRCVKESAFNVIHLRHCSTSSLLDALKDMPSKGVYTTVLMVDSAAEIRSPLSNSSQTLAQSQRDIWTQTVLFLLVSMALVGISVNACFIHHLYKTKLSSVKITALCNISDEQLMENSTVPQFQKRTKPLAHLKAGKEQPGTDGVMPWNVSVELDLHQLEYKENKLVVQKEGYYYIYSKLTFDGDKDSFTHLMVMTANRFSTQFPIELLRNRYHRNQPKPTQKGGSIDSSYLGGMFHFFKGDAVFVLVRNGTVRLLTVADNYFGMFMV
ncbi:hypothetical protein NFI96_023953 [Prochilodus magdalenae]|nr:hypothetical protein NFI96_023953 [Prochilodus magdalenae]